MRILNLIDTSGSISIENLDACLKDISNNISNEIAIGCFDTELRNFKTIDNISDIEEYKLHGRGGTILKDSLIEAISRFNNPDKIVIYSDFLFSVNDIEYLKSMIESKIFIDLVMLGDPIDAECIDVFYKKHLRYLR